ncbi:MAG: SH3 domain-containing protein, partial [Akkermansiaceae bacterium]|nr:SH3 domain-containing protein [Akkermansiaceae bacterium]
EPTPTVSPEIAIGRYVRVTGTGGYGLSLRSGPGENYTRMDVALDGEVFVVVDGPTVTAGSGWWKIRDSENEEREWWAIGNFLEPVDHP